MSSISRKQKQQIEIGIAFAVILGQIIFLFFLFKGGSIKNDKAALSSLTVKVEDAQRLLARKDAIRSNLNKTLEDLESLRVHVPPSIDPYAWAYEYVSARAVSCGIHLDAVNEEQVKADDVSKDAKKAAKVSYYAVRVSMECSYSQIICFLKKLEEDNPLLLVAELKIETIPNNVNSHKTSVLLRWPSGFVMDDGGVK